VFKKNIILGEQKMEPELKQEIVDRLQKEKDKLHSEYRSKAYQAGRQYVQIATYETILFIWNVVLPNGGEFRYNTCPNSANCLKDYFKEIVSYDDFLLDEDIWCTWMDAWLNGFKEAWLEIYAEIQ
jgi:hypothetical protein